MEFDYVIVGAGSAGCVLANRLSADPDAGVCLIEAGPPDTHPLIHVPLGAAFMQHKVVNWGYETVPQTHAAGRRMLAPRGKTLGGSSAIHGNVYIRGHRLDYDDWAAAGNPGWSYREVLPYFIRSEANDRYAAPYHGTDGPLRVGNVESYSPLVDMFFDAARGLGYPVRDDLNVPELDGFGRRQATIWKGRRQSSAVAFLRPVRGRSNLEVITDALADKVLFSGRHATGVEVIRAGARQRITARGEVLLAGGTVGSPSILMRSGLGDPGELQRCGIPLLHALPGVGANLQDHIKTYVSHETDSRLPYGLCAAKLPWAAWQVAKYVLFRTGIFANNIVHASGHVRTRPELERPDVVFALFPSSIQPYGRLRSGHGYSLLNILLAPKSRGRVRLASADPAADPLIDPNYWSEQADVEAMVRAIRLGRKILSQPAWDRVRGPETAPGPSVTSDEALADYVRRTSSTSYHLVGTCKMGPEARDAVVDPRLRVWGVEGLRVADASIMPTILIGNTNAAAIMIGEKASDMVLGKPPLPAASLPG